MQSQPNAKVVVVMPAYNAAKTLHMTYAELPHNMVDLVILVDDGSSDRTVEIARKLGLELFVHNRNYGYGANQKTCYREALAAGADIVIMVHPDYQYTPKLIPAMASMVASGPRSPSSISGIGRFRGGCSSNCRCTRIRTTSCSTTRSSPRRRGTDT